MHQYDLTQNASLLNFIAVSLPWFEVFCGLLLLAGVAVRGTALTLTVMLVPFTLLVLHRALLLHAAQNIPFCAVKFDCGCGTGEEFICRKLLENFLLLVLSSLVVGGTGAAILPALPPVRSLKRYESLLPAAHIVLNAPVCLKNFP